MPTVTAQNVTAVDRRRRLARRLSWWAYVPLVLSWGWLPLVVWLEPHQPTPPPHSGSEVAAGIGAGALLAVEVVSGMIGTLISSVLVISAFLLKHRSVTLWIAAAINAIFWVGGVLVGWQVLPFLR